MKRDWDLLRDQLLAIEEDKDFHTSVLGGVPDQPKWGRDQSEADFKKSMEEYEQIEARIFGHLEMLVDNGYVEGITISRSYKTFHYGLMDPRLTMAGHDLLDTIRSKPVWDKIKSIAKAKGVELSVDAIKGLAGIALKAVIGN